MAINLFQQASRADEALATALRNAPILFKHWGKEQFAAWLKGFKASDEISDQQTLELLQALLDIP